MKEIYGIEIDSVNGGQLAEDIAFWLGAQLGYLQNQAKEYIYNEGFRQQYG